MEKTKFDTLSKEEVLTRIKENRILLNTNIWKKEADGTCYKRTTKLATVLESMVERYMIEEGG